MNWDRFFNHTRNERDVMLVLSRKPGEAIHIGSNIVMRVIEIRGNKVRIGFDAPDDVKIVRSEIVVTETTTNPDINPLIVL